MIVFRVFLAIFSLTYFIALPSVAENSNNGSEGHSKVLDLKGKDGADARNGVDRSHERAFGTAATGPRGGDAGLASPGQTAGDATLKISEPIKGVIQLEGAIRLPGEGTGSHKMFQVDIHEPGRILIDAEGGNGGAGGKGGGGGMGGKGSDGYDATRYSSGTDGGRGGRGGRGGHGTSGEKAGDGGHIVLKSAAGDTSLLMMFEWDIDKGIGGKKGRHGEGGAGGPGGDGGSSYHWTETETEHYTDSNGNQQTRTKTTHHSNSGGSDGPRGYSGDTPSTPLYDGADGEDGSFQILVESPDGSTKVYDRRYDLQILSYDIVSQNKDGIFEPGEPLYVRNITVKNTGGMPTPMDAKVRLFLHNREYTQSTGKVLHVPKVLQPGETYTFIDENYLSMDVNSLHFKPGQERLVWEQNSTPHVMMERVEREFRNAPNPTRIKITFPIEIETIGENGGISGLRSLAPGEASKIFFRIKNISGKAFGSKSDLARAIQFKIEGELGIEDQLSQLQLFDKSGSSLDYDNGILEAIEHLGPGETALVEGVVGIARHSKPYTSKTIAAGLSLEGTNSKDGMTEIQRPSIEIRSTKVYKKEPGSKILLIANSGTEKRAIEAWQEVAKELGTQLTVWDLSYESHLMLTKPLSDGSTLLDDFSGGTIVIPTNTFSLTDDAHNPKDQLRKSEFLKGLTEANVNFLFMGPEADSGYLEKMLIPSDGRVAGNQEGQFSRHGKVKQFLDRYKNGVLAAQVAEDQGMDFTSYFNRIMVNRYLLWFGEPNESYLEAQASKVLNKIHHSDPNERWLTVTHFRPQILKQFFWGALKVWNYGGIIVAKTLRRDTGAGTFFPTSQADVNDPEKIKSHLTRVALLSTLGFEGNVQLLERYISDSEFYQSAPEQLETLRDTLMLYLAREQGRLRQPGFGLSHSSSKMTQLMTQLKRLTQLNAAVDKNTPQPVVDVIIELAAKMKFLASVNTTWWEYIIPFRTNPKVRNATHALADKFVERAFGLSQGFWGPWFGKNSDWSSKEINSRVNKKLSDYKLEMQKLYADVKGRKNRRNSIKDHANNAALEAGKHIVDGSDVSQNGAGYREKRENFFARREQDNRNKLRADQLDNYSKQTRSELMVPHPHGGDACFDLLKKPSQLLHRIEGR